MARDPYKYFRIEAREILDALTSGVLELEKGTTPEIVARLMRAAHTLKGASRVVRLPDIAEIAHRIEDVLSPHRDGTVAATRASADAVLQLVDTIAGKLSSIDTPAAAPPASAAAPAPAPAPLEIAETVRIDIGDMDGLLSGLSESAVSVGTVERAARSVAEIPDTLGITDPALRQSLAKSHRHLVDGLERLKRQLQQVQDDASRLRLVSADTLFAPLSRAARDAAQSAGKRVELVTEGGDVRLDAPVLAAVRDAMLHVVRNAVAHGIESDRAAVGKPASGRIHLQVERRGSFATFSCRDDGRGVDVDAVARVAREKGWLAADAALDDDTVSRLLFTNGLSTSAGLTELAGRGVGLDVVRTVAEGLKGAARVRSERGRGTTVTIEVPISMSSVPALAVEAGGAVCWLPLAAVAGTLRASAADIVSSPEGASVRYGDSAVAFAPLGRVLGGGSAARSDSGAWTTVVVRSPEGTAAVGVDRLFGVRRIVMRALPPAVGSLPAVAGAVLDTAGDPELVLDPVGLAAAVRRGTGRSVAAESASPKRLPILIIDDSLTTRMLEQSILETAGYEVEMAESAEEGLKKARLRRYGLFLVDVEMPGMNGFEFVAKTRADAQLATTPAILVTSLASPEDRRRGLEVGASAYMVKGEFDELRLRQLIRDLVG